MLYAALVLVPVFMLWLVCGYAIRIGGGVARGFKVPIGFWVVATMVCLLLSIYVEPNATVGSHIFLPGFAISATLGGAIGYFALPLFLRSRSES